MCVSLGVHINEKGWGSLREMNTDPLTQEYQWACSGSRKYMRCATLDSSKKVCEAVSHFHQQQIGKQEYNFKGKRLITVIGMRGMSCKMKNGKKWERNWEKTGGGKRGFTWDTLRTTSPLTTSPWTKERAATNVRVTIIFITRGVSPKGRSVSICLDTHSR